MSEQPEALRLADGNDECAKAWIEGCDAHKFRKDTAAELRRLHKVLQSVANIAHSGGVAGMSESDALIAIRRATLMEFNKAGSHDQRRAAINKAEGEMK